MRLFDNSTRWVRGTAPGPAHTVPLSEVLAAARHNRDLHRSWQGRAAEIEEAIQNAREYLREIQHDDGHWCGQIDGCTILESEYMLMMRFLDRWDDASVARAGEFIRRDQRPDGGWAIHPDGPPDVSTSVKSYFVLKLLGDPADAPHMAEARRCIRSLGGLEAVNSFTKIYLAIFGQWSWEDCPAIPPEIILLPESSYFSIYQMSSWTRVMVVPLSVIWTFRPIKEVPGELGLDELRVGERRIVGSRSLRRRGWERFFVLMDRTLKLADRFPFKPWRKRALEEAEAWILDRMDLTDGIGAIFPPIINSIFALRCLGYDKEHPRIQQQLDALESLKIEDEETVAIQPCVGAVWDTSLALRTCLEVAESPSEVRLQRAAEWLLEREVRYSGDWRVNCPEGTPGGWYFQYQNHFNPDCDDTAQVLTDLARVRLTDPKLEEAARGARRRGLKWLLAMQNDDGGWAAFDKNCDNEILTYVPFADHNAMLDPSCEDITGRVLEALAHHGMDLDDEPVKRAVRFLRRRQTREGAWFGRWGCNYIYGTSLALKGLSAVGEDLRLPRYRRTSDWLMSRQNTDGGWGESLESYELPSLRGRGPSTATQTAWALLALFALGDFRSASVLRGVDYLLDTRTPEGVWCDDHWTGTGFPKVFYLRYHLYDKYFPPLALSTFLRHV